jgi:hypothetical protein
MKPWKLILTILMSFAFLLPAPTDAQQVSDTLQITVTGTLTEVVLLGEYVTPPQAGDSILLVATAYDEDGTEMNAMFSFFTEDSTTIRLEARTNPNESLAIAVKKGTVKLWVVAEPITEIIVASFRPPDSLNFTGFDTIPVGGTLQYCAWAVRAGRLVVESPGPPTCPIVFLPEQPGELLKVFAINRQVGRGAFNAMGRGMRVYRGEGEEEVR